MAGLKPCPFCGGPANRRIQKNKNIPGAYDCAAYCLGARCASISFIYSPPGWSENPEKAVKTAISKAWNRRTE